MTLTHGSLFAGIGGFDYGFKCAGIKTVWQVEIDAYCRKVLARHFPAAQRFDDIRECGGLNGEREHSLPWVDILSGGFPCQDISNAGKRAGIDGERSGLWSEYARIVRELRPRYVVVENVAALLNRGMERILGDLAACGYDAEWQSIRASDVGAPDRRERIWIVAYPNGSRCSIFQREYSDATPYGRTFTLPAIRWPNEPNVDRVADGIPNIVDRLRGLGNAIVPQIGEFIGRCIFNHAQEPFAKNGPIGVSE